MSEERTELTGKGGFIRILVERANPAGDLNIPDGAKSIVIFEEPGALEEAAKLATSWFRKYLGTG